LRGVAVDLKNSDFKISGGQSFVASVPSYLSFPLFALMQKVEQKNQDARPRPLKGSTRAQQHPVVWSWAYDRQVVVSVPFPTAGVRSKEGRERCYREIRQALWAANLFL
jgi:hypothetical protein